MNTDPTHIHNPEVVKEARLAAQAVAKTDAGRYLIAYLLAKFPPAQRRFRPGDDALGAAFRDGQSDVASLLENLTTPKPDKPTTTYDDARQEERLH